MAKNRPILTFSNDELEELTQLRVRRIQRARARAIIVHEAQIILDCYILITTINQYLPAHSSKVVHGFLSNAHQIPYDLVRRYQRDNILLKEPQLARCIPARKPAKALGAGKAMFGGATKGASPGEGGKALGKDKQKDKGKAKAQGTPPKPAKKHAAPGGSDDDGKSPQKKKKKSKDTPAPPARLDAKPRSGLVYAPNQ